MAPGGIVYHVLNRSAGPAPSSGSAAEDDSGHPAVSLVTTAGTKSLKAIEGDHKQFAAPFVGLRHFLEFDDQHAATRIKDRRPTLELHLGKSPGNHWWLVRLDPDDDDPTRGLDLESAGMYGGAQSVRVACRLVQLPHAGQNPGPGQGAAIHPVPYDRVDGRAEALDGRESGLQRRPGRARCRQHHVALLPARRAVRRCCRL